MHLEQVGHDHVPVGAGRVVERGPALDRQRLRHVDLHVPDVITVPDRLEQPVREPERQDVVDRLLAQEVVDPEDLRLVEDRVHRLVQLAGGLQVGAERLLDDDPGVAGGQARRAEHAHHRGERGGRHGQVEQPPGRAADLLFRPLDRRLQVGGVFPGSAAANDRRSAKDGQDGSVGLVMQKSAQACSACARNCSSVSANCGGEAPTTRYSRGSRPAACRWNSPGSSLRLARSPVAPNSTKTWLSGRGDPFVLMGTLRPSSPRDRRTPSAARTGPSR